MKVKFRKVVESAIKPPEVGFCTYNIHPLSSYNIEPLERAGIRTGICFDFPDPRKLIVGSETIYEQLVIEVIPEESLFLNKGILLPHKTIDRSHEGEIIIEAINITLPDFLLFKESAKSDLARSHFFGSTNSVRLGKENPIAKLRINVVQSIKVS